MEMRYGGEAHYVSNPFRNYQLFTQADMSKTERELGFYPEYDIARGVREIIQTSCNY